MIETPTQILRYKILENGEAQLQQKWILIPVGIHPSSAEKTEWRPIPTVA